MKMNTLKHTSRRKLKIAAITQCWGSLVSNTPSPTKTALSCNERTYDHLNSQQRYTKTQQRTVRDTTTVRESRRV